MHLPTAITLPLLLGGIHIASSNPLPSSRGATAWKTLAPISTGARQEHGTVALGNKIYIIGGVVPDPSNSSLVQTVPYLDEYDIATDSWSRKADAPWAYNHPNVESVDGKIYLLGGLLAGNLAWRAKGHSAVYDPSKNSWSTLPDMPEGTERGSACTVNEGENIYLAGGLKLLDLVTEEQDTVATFQAYNVKSGSWTHLPPLPEGRDHGGAAIIDGVYWQVGGRFRGQQNVRGSVFSIDLSRPKQWKSHSEMPTPRGGLSAAAVGRKIFTFGGEGNPAPDSNGVYPDVEAYDVRTDTWAKLADMPIPRHGLAAASTGGVIYLPGGGSQIGGSGANCIMQAFVP